MQSRALSERIHGYRNPAKRFFHGPDLPEAASDSVSAAEWTEKSLLRDYIKAKHSGFEILLPPVVILSSAVSSWSCC